MPEPEFARLSPRPLEELIEPVLPLGLDDTLAHAAERLAGGGGGLPVVDADGRLAGYLSERELLAAMFPPYLQELRHTEFLTKDFPSLVRRARDAADRPVRELMEAKDELAFIDADDSESHAAELFLHERVRTLPVVDGEHRVIGVVRAVDVVRSLLRACGRQSA